MDNDWYRGRAGVPVEILAVILIVMGVLVIVFPHMIAWLVGLTLIAVGVIWMITALSGRRYAMRPPYDARPPAYGPPPARPPYP